jgi:hypothetical protein
VDQHARLLPRSAIIAFRAVTALGCATVFFIGWFGDGYEPSSEWLLPLAVVGFGAAVGSWWALAAAVLPVLYALPDGTSGDPPAVPGGIMLGLLGAFLLAVGVAVSKGLSGLIRAPSS